MVKSIVTYLIAAISFVSNAQEALQFTVKEVTVPFNGEIYSPTFMDSVLVVCGTRKDRVLYTHLDKDGKEPIDLYVLDPANGYEYSRFDEKFRSDFHDGPISFNADASRCVISRNLRLDQRFKAIQEDENQLGLFESRFENGEWTIPEGLLINSNEFNCTHPALSENGEILIFSSNRPGGFGGYDLWKMEKRNGKWGEPENLGSGVNTSSNEFFPNWIGNTLYFSANRKEFGGLDIYQVDGKGEFATTKILDEPLNSAFDDFGFTSNTQGITGYFSSNRGGTDQLWSFEMRFPEFNNCDSLINDDFCYTLLEETAYELGGIESLIYQWDINGEKKFGYEIDYCFPGPGVYEISVDIYDTIIKKTYANQASYTLELTLEEQPYITSPDSIQIGREFELSVEKTYLPGVDIDSYYWIFSDGTLFTTKNPSYAFQTPGEYQVTLGVTGTKEGEPFKDCSYKFIVATVDSIAPRVVSVVKPMGNFDEDGQLIQSERPIEKNDSTTIVHSIEIASSAEQLSDTNEIFAAVVDRFMVNTTFDPSDSLYIYSIGEWLNLADAHETWKSIVEMGYQDAKIYSREKDSLNDLPLNTAFSLENIEFDYNKSDIREDAKKTLEILVLLLNGFKDVKLIIAAHTDDVGSEMDNLELSEKRAESIKRFLIDRGIDAARIRSKGVGETEPKFSNETAEGRAGNRRVEFKLITNEKVEILPE